MRPQLFVMVKEPSAGRVKTRLGRDIGMTRSAWWFRHQSSALIRRLSSDPRWQTVLAVAPDQAGMNSRVWPQNLPKWPQGRGDLGDRMGAIFRHAPAGPIVIVGADIPGITPDHIARAFAALGRDDTVFGPAPDGGYWLVGMKRGGRAVPKSVLQNVRWSSAHALRDSMASIPDSKIALIDTLQDVDTLADLQAIIQ